MPLTISITISSAFWPSNRLKSISKHYSAKPASHFQRPHDLNELAALLPAHLGYPENFSESISRLDRYAVEFRYPGASATEEVAREAIVGGRALRDWCRKMIVL